MTDLDQRQPGKTLWNIADQLRASMKEIEANDCNLNISRYVSTAEDEEEIDLAQTHT